MEESIQVSIKTANSMVKVLWRRMVIAIAGLSRMDTKMALGCS